MINAISIILDLINYSFINKSSLFLSLFSLISLIFLKKNKLLNAFIFGFIYDLLFTNLYFFNALIFLLIELLIIKYFKYFKFNYINNIILTIIIILIYFLISFIIFNITKLNIITFKELFYILKHFIIINILYIIILTKIYKDKNTN